MFSVQAISIKSRKHIYIDVFRFKKVAIEFYNEMKKEVDMYAEEYKCRTVELLSDINKTGRHFRIGYLCIDKDGYELFRLELFNESDCEFRHFIENEYCFIDGVKTPYYKYEELVWRNEFPDLFVSNITIPLHVNR